MLVKGTHTIGLKVIARNTGNEIAKVEDVIYDPQTNYVRALLVDNGGWFSEAKVILMEDVYSIGEDAVITNQESIIRTASEVPERIANIAENKNYLVRSKVLSEDGHDLGSVNDIEFDSQTGQVHSLEVSKGLISDTTSGKKHINITDILTVGEDSLIVKKYTEIKLEQEKGGIQKVVEDTSRKTQENLSNLQDKAQQLAQSTQENVQNAAGRVQEAGSEAINKSKDVAQTATQKAGTNPHVQNASEQIKTTYQNVRDDIQSGELENRIKTNAEITKSQIQEGLDMLKNFAGEKTEQAKSTITNTRKKDAIGKYSKVNILDQSDQVIVPIGGLVDNKVVQAAEDNDMLDKLLNNLSDTPVTLT